MEGDIPRKTRKEEAHDIKALIVLFLATNQIQSIAQSHAEKFDYLVIRCKCETSH